MKCDPFVLYALQFDSARRANSRKQSYGYQYDYTKGKFSNDLELKETLFA